MPRPFARKEPVARALGFPIRPQERQQRGGEHDGAILAALTLVDADDPALTIDVGDFEMGRFGDPQPRRRANSNDYGTKPFWDFIMATFDRCRQEVSPCN